MLYCLYCLVDGMFVFVFVFVNMQFLNMMFFDMGDDFDGECMIVMELLGLCFGGMLIVCLIVGVGQIKGVVCVMGYSL